MNEKVVSKIIKNIENKSNKCKTISELIDFAFNFKEDDFDLKPLQNKEELRNLLELCVIKKPKTIVEIGTAGGGTLFLLSRILNYNLKIISIDLPGGKFGGELFPDWKIPIYKSFERPYQNISFIRDDSQKIETLEKVMDIFKQKIDLLIIDGDHTYQGVSADFKRYYANIENDSIIVFHDINQKLENVEVWKFWEELKKEYKTFEIISLPKDKGFGIGIIYKNPLDTNYEKFLRKILENKDRKIEKLKNNPISAILEIYQDRDDLQKEFPEVEKGNFDKLFLWVAENFRNKKSIEIDLMRIVQNYRNWYESFKSKYEAETEKEKIISKINSYETIIEKNKDEIRILNNFNDEKNQVVESLKKNVDEKNQVVESLKKNVDEKNQVVESLKKNVDEKNQVVESLKKNVDEKNQVVESLKKNVDEKNQVVESLKKNVDEKNQVVESLKKNVDEKNQVVESLKKNVDEKNQVVESLKKNVDEKNQVVESLKKNVDEKNQVVESLKKNVDEKNQVVESLKKNVDEKNQVVESLKKNVDIISTTIKRKDHYISKLEEFKIKKQNEVDILNNSLKEIHYTNKNLQNEMDSIKQSFIFKNMKRITKFADPIMKKFVKTEVGKIIVTSSSMIKNEGIKNYVNAAKEKAERKEFRVLSEMSFTEQSDLLEVVKQNKEKRLEIKPHTKNEIKNDEFNIVDEKNLND